MSDTDPLDPDPRHEDDLIHEDDNAIVTDWFGQDAERDALDADRAMREAGGDTDRAERIFEERRQPHQRERFNIPPDERTGNVPS